METPQLSRGRFLAGSLAAVALVGCDDGSPFPTPTPSPSPSPTPSFPIWNFKPRFALQIHYITMTDDQLALIAQSGATGVRMDIVATNVGGSKWAYDVAGYNALTKRCASHGLRVLYTMPYLPKVGPVDFTSYNALVEAFFADNDADGEGGNEWDGWLLWRDANGIPQPAPAIAWQIAAGRAARAGMTKSGFKGYLATGGLSTIRADWVQAMVDAGAFATYDYCGIHPYGMPSNQAIIDGYVALKPILGSVPVVTTEYGVPNPSSATVTLADKSEISFVEWLVDWLGKIVGSPLVGIYTFVKIPSDAQDYGFVDSVTGNPKGAFLQLQKFLTTDDDD